MRTPRDTNVLDAHWIFGCSIFNMKKVIFAIFGATLIIATGCVKTVDDSHAFATSWNTDDVSGRYARTPDQVYQAASKVVARNGVILSELIPHQGTNDVRSLAGRVRNEKVWVRVEAIDPKTTQVDVQARTSMGFTDVSLVHELEKEIAIELATTPQ